METTRDPDGGDEILEVQWLEGEPYGIGADPDSSELVKLAVEDLEHWEIDTGAFLDALAETNSLVGSVRELGGGIYRLGRRRLRPGPDQEVLFVAEQSPIGFEHSVLSVQEAVASAQVVVLLAQPHALPGASVARLSERGVVLLDLTERLDDELMIEWLPSAQLVAHPAADLLLVTATHEVVYKTHPVELGPQPFGLLLHLARNPPAAYLHHSAVPADVMEPRELGSQGALSNAIRRIRDAFRDTALAYDLPVDEVDRLIENRPRVGYRLTLPRDRIRIV